MERTAVANSASSSESVRTTASTVSAVPSGVGRQNMPSQHVSARVRCSRTSGRATSIEGDPASARATCTWSSSRRVARLRSVTSSPMLVDPIRRPASSRRSVLFQAISRRSPDLRQDEHLLVRVDRALTHLGHELLVGGVERLGPRAADQLRARVAGQVGEVLVAEGDPAVEVEADGDQVDVLEQLPEPALGLLERAEAGAEVGLELLVLERQAGRAADGLEELRVVGERRVMDERRHPLSRPFDDRDGPVGAFGWIERPPVRVDVDVQVAEPVCELEAGIADRLSQRLSDPAGLVAARELVDQLCDRTGAGQVRAQDADQEPERDARKGQRRDDECDRADGVSGGDLDQERHGDRRDADAARREDRREHPPCRGRCRPPALDHDRDDGRQEHDADRRREVLRRRRDVGRDARP